MNKPLYQKNSIGRISSLAKTLSIDEDFLISTANHANSFYYLAKRIEKADGSFRDVYGVERTLKYLQRKILKRIFYNVKFPHYLYGSIKDVENPRTHVAAAQVHQKASLLVGIDISNFFPSLNSEVVFDIWKKFFNFSPPVAKLLTQLTTLNDFLPQGAPTSSSLANLAFWDYEYKIVDRLHAKRLTYTRYVDDVIVSSRESVPIEELYPIFNSIFGMFRHRGVKPNRNKIDISTSGHNMCVHNLNVNSGVPSIPKKERSCIRAAVWQCKKEYAEYNQSKTYLKLWNSTLGRVNYLKQFHSTEAKTYLRLLQDVQPCK